MLIIYKMYGIQIKKKEQENEENRAKERKY